MLEIRLLQDENDEKRWDDFARDSPSSTFYHQIGWRNVIERTYGHKPYYLFAQENKQIVGILPLFFISNYIFGKRLVSLPFAPYGGVCSGNANVIKGLLTQANKLMMDLNTKYVELRCFSDDIATDALPKNDQYITSILKLSCDPDNIWRLMNQKRRNTVRKAYKYGLTTETGEEYEGIEEFYSLYARNMRELGTPVHSAKFFSELKVEFPHSIRATFVRYEGKIIAGIFLLLSNNTITSGWGASLRDYLYYAPNDLLYWEAIKYGCEQGFEHFDFGRSLAGSGSAKFKKEWGSVEVKLKYCYLLNNTDKIPHLNPSIPKYARLSKIWRRLPLMITNRLGPIIRKSIV